MLPRNARLRAMLRRARDRVVPARVLRRSRTLRAAVVVFVRRVLSPVP